MFHSSVVYRKPVFLKLCHHIVISFVVILSGLFCAGNKIAEAQSTSVISAVQAESSGMTNTIRIQTSAEPAYTAYELFNPSRIVIDIANATVADGNSFTLSESLPITLATTTISDSQPSLTRLEFTFNDEYTSYDVKTVNNDILLSVAMNGASSHAKVDQAPASQISKLIAKKQDIESQLPSATLTGESSSTGANSADGQTTADAMRNNFSFGSYNKTKISVDFYKIDLHNVFRLIREVSDINLVVDDSVSGSLTLALNDVPWDFALDIILNLKDLQKVERFNTVVILPKEKEFNWPETAADNLDFEANEEVIVQEAIVIQQQLSQSPEIVAAKQSIQKGRAAEKNGDYENAIAAYSEAFTQWSDNDRLANKIASIYLVYLRQNARAVHFAKQALAVNSNNASAALNAAVALANMHENSEAQQYFDQSVSVAEPSKEALLSYAVFSEEQGQYDGAIKLLDKYEILHGANLDSMIAYARLLDKQGNQNEATEKYKAILLSGYQIPPDLRKYINSRIALNQ